MKYIAIVLLVLIPGCMFVRIDHEPERISATLVSVLKNINIDPNGYSSDPERVNLLTPWGMMKGGE